MIPYATLLRYGAVVLAVVALLGLVYRAGGSAPRAELRAYRAEVAAQAKQAKLDKEKSDREYAMDVANREFAWAEWLRKHPLQTRRVVAGVCSDNAGNQRLSRAVDEYRTEMGRLRQEIRQCYLDADGLQAQLINVTEWGGRNGS